MKNVLVFGSINLDLLVKMEKIPEIGETVLGESLIKKPGGKGNNQAISASLLGAKTTMYGRVGNDEYGHILIENFKKNNVNVDFIEEVDDYSTGTAIINIDSNANNTIVVIPGANQSFENIDYIGLDDLFSKNNAVLFQFEIPKKITFKAIEIAAENNIKIILDPAPVTSIPDSIYKVIDIIMPNIHEARELSGLDLDATINELAGYFIKKGVEIVLLTMGTEGVFIKNATREYKVPGITVKSVDSTGAGDCFAGAFAAFYNGENLLEAVKLSNIAAALSTTKTGAQSSIPDLKEVKNYI